MKRNEPPHDRDRDPERIGRHDPTSQQVRADERDSADPTAVAPDQVDETVPGASERAGKVGPNAADPPKAGSPEGLK